MHETDTTQSPIVICEAGFRKTDQNSILECAALGCRKAREAVKERGTSRCSFRVLTGEEVAA